MSVAGNALPFRLILAAVIAVIFLGAAKQSAAETVVLGLSQNEVSITTRFDGSQLLIFGAVKRDRAVPEDSALHVIVTVEGPSEPFIVRRKERRFGIWVNTDQVELGAAPTFYAVATTGPMEDIVSDTEDLRHKISIGRAIRSVGAASSVDDPNSFVDALIRIKSDQEHYLQLDNGVMLDEATLFRTDIDMPSALTEGSYRTRVFLLRNGAVLDTHVTEIEVRKVGMERFLYNLSRTQSLLYGLMSLAIAIAAGWLASAVFSLLRI